MRTASSSRTRLACGARDDRAVRVAEAHLGEIERATVTSEWWRERQSGCAASSRLCLGEVASVSQ